MRNQRLKEYLADHTGVPTNQNPRAQDLPFGDPYTVKNQDTVRLWFTNPCGIGLDHKNS